MARHGQTRRGRGERCAALREGVLISPEQRREGASTGSNNTNKGTTNPHKGRAVMLQKRAGSSTAGGTSARTS